MKKLLLFILKFIIITVITYGFLALCNWSLNIEYWNGFSRFILGAEGVIFLFVLFSEDYL